MQIQKAAWLVFLSTLCAGLVDQAFAQGKVDTNVVYGMYSGTALLMDVHRPAQPNGFAILFIAGSGWTAPLGYAAAPLKESSQVASDALPLVSAGYTVFAISHRATPTFRYPAPMEDAQRAVRFIRHSAGRFGIDANRIGGAGGSSGAHLLSLLGTMDGYGDSSDPDPVNRQSAKLQCLAVRAAPADLTRMTPSNRADNLALLLGVRVDDSTPRTSSEYKTAWAASPINYVSQDDAPFLLVHGDADRTVPFGQSEAMEVALRKVGVPARLIRIPGGDHGPNFPGATTLPDYKREIIRWFDTHLRGTAVQ